VTENYPFSRDDKKGAARLSSKLRRSVPGELAIDIADRAELMLGA